MMRSVLFIPRDEITTHLLKNIRKDLKIVTTTILTPERRERLKARGKSTKEEVPLEGDVWRHSESEEANLVCAAQDFSFPPIDENKNPFAVSFATVGSEESLHWHEQHSEIYYSELRLSADYRCPSDSSMRNCTLETGGLMVFGPRVRHKMTIAGLTLVIELPAVPSDRHVPSNA